jgi:hypothetical protein
VGRKLDACKVRELNPGKTFTNRGSRATCIALLIAHAVAASGCAIHSPKHLGDSGGPPISIPGTLYVSESEGIVQQPLWRIIRNGKVVGTFVAEDFAVARESPMVKVFVRLDSGSVHGAAGASSTNAQPLPGGCNVGEVALSQDGRYGLCSSNLTLVLFDVHSRKVIKLITKLANDGPNQYAFLQGNSIAAMIADETCKSDRVGNVLMVWARVYFVHLDGTRIRNGPCAFFVLSGKSKVAYGSYRDGKFIYSIDGNVWFPGWPYAFVGADRLVVLPNNVGPPALDTGELPYLGGASNVGAMRWSE